MLKDLIIYTPMYITFFWILVLVLSSVNQSNRAKSFLGIFMIAAFLIYLSHAVFFKKLLHIYLVFDPVYTAASLSVYPLYYLYIRLLTVGDAFRRKNLKLLFPALLMGFLSALFYLIMTPAEKTMYLNKFFLGENINETASLVVRLQRMVFIFSRVIFAVQVVYFLFKGRKLVIVYNNRIANFYSDLESKTIDWVNFLLYSFVATSLMSIVFNIIGREVFLNSVVLLFIPSLIFSILLFFIGLQGYMQNHTVADLINDEKQQPERNLKEFNQAQLKEKLLLMFSEDKIYNQSDLKITHVSSQLQTNRTYISNLINQEFSCSFSDFVNKYRFLEARKLLQDESFDNYSLHYISEVAGFGSLNTFIRIFKEHEGTTPGKFRENCRMQPVLRDLKTTGIL